jgi:hypothetical protein
MQCSAAPTSNNESWRSSASCAANNDVGATCILQGTLNIFMKGGGAMQRQCCAYLKQRELAVERLVRCRQRRWRDLHPAGNIKYFDGRGGRGSCLELCCVQHSVRAYLRPNQFHYACSNAGEHFQYKGEGLCCAVLLAVQCCAYFSNKPLAVEHSQCCNDDGGRLRNASEP